MRNYGCLGKQKLVLFRYWYAYLETDWSLFTWVSLIFVTISCHFFQLDLQLQDDGGGDISSFITNGEWDLLGKL